MVTLTREEWSELSPEEKKYHLEQETKNVFGADYKRDRQNRPVEQGLGSKQQPTIQSMNALLQHEGQDAYDREVADAIKRGVWPPKPHTEMA